MKMILDIELQNDITFRLEHSLPLCFILLNKNVEALYHQTFIDMVGVKNNNEFITLNFKNNDFYHKAMHYVENYSMEESRNINDIIGFIKERIDNEEYLNVGVDEYYLSNKERYKQFPYAHQTLIYGYDDEKKVLHGIGFDKDHIFSKLEYDFSEFTKAFSAVDRCYKESAPWLGDYELTGMKNDISEKYIYNPVEAIKEFDNYLHVNEATTDYHCSGMDSLDLLFETLHLLMNGKEVFEYANLHMLTEHKKAVFMRLGYMHKQLGGESKIDQVQKEYMKVFAKMDKVRYTFLQRIIDENGTDKKFLPPLLYGKAIPDKENTFIKLPTDRHFLTNCISQLEDVKKMEYDILSRAYEKMEMFK